MLCNCRINLKCMQNLIQNADKSTLLSSVGGRILYNWHQTKFYFTYSFYLLHTGTLHLNNLRDHCTDSDRPGLGEIQPLLAHILHIQCCLWPSDHHQSHSGWTRLWKCRPPQALQQFLLHLYNHPAPISSVSQKIKKINTLMSKNISL